MSEPANKRTDMSYLRWPHLSIIHLPISYSNVWYREPAIHA